MHHAYDRSHRKEKTGSDSHAGGTAFHRPGLHGGGYPGLPDVRAADGHLFPRHDAGGNSAAYHGNGALRRRGRSFAARRAHCRQALDRRRRRQDLACALPDGGGMRRQNGENVRPRSRAHRRHDRQARILPRLLHRHDARKIPRNRRERRLCDRRADGESCPGG